MSRSWGNHEVVGAEVRGVLWESQAEGTDHASAPGCGMARCRGPSEEPTEGWLCGGS